MSLSADQIRNGLPFEYDYPIAERPAESDMRDGVNIWFFEENGSFGVPRLAMDAVGDSWGERMIQANMAFPDGRVLDGWATAPAVPTLDENGKPTILGNSILQFRLIEPFQRWRLSYDNEAIDTDIRTQMAKRVDRNRKTRVRLNAELTLQIPVWSQVFADDDPRPEAGWMGRGWRYESPILVEGTLEIDGKPRSFKGRGNIVRRKSKRASSADMYGHCWQAAIFSDGRAFGTNVYPLRDDRPQYNTGFLYKDGKMYDAKVVDAPWLRQLTDKGDNVSLVIETKLGQTRIKGETLLSTYVPDMESMGGLSLHQGGVRYSWDDQTAMGMIERSGFIPAYADA